MGNAVVVNVDKPMPDAPLLEESSSLLDDYLVDYVPLERLVLLAHADPDACCHVARAYLEGRAGVIRSDRRAQYYLNRANRLLKQSYSNQTHARATATMEEEEGLFSSLQSTENEIKKLESKLQEIEAKKSKLQKFIEKYFYTAQGHFFFNLMNPVRISVLTTLLSFPIFGPLTAFILGSIGLPFHTLWLIWEFSIMAKNSLVAAAEAEEGNKIMAAINAWRASWDHGGRKYAVRNSGLWVVILAVVTMLSVVVAKLDVLDPSGTLSTPIKIVLNLVINTVVAWGFFRDDLLVEGISDDAMEKLDREKQLLDYELAAIADQLLVLSACQNVETYRELSKHPAEYDSKTLIFNKIRALLDEQPNISLEEIKEELLSNKVNYEKRKENIEAELSYEQVVKFRDSGVTKFIKVGSVLCAIGVLLSGLAVFCPPLILPGLILSSMGTTMIVTPGLVFAGNVLVDKFASEEKKEAVKTFWAKAMAPMMEFCDEVVRRFEKLEDRFDDYFGPKRRVREPVASPEDRGELAPVSVTPMSPEEVRSRQEVHFTFKK
jgi:hypothetical protein